MVRLAMIAGLVIAAAGSAQESALVLSARERQTRYPNITLKYRVDGSVAITQWQFTPALAGASEKASLAVAPIG